MGKPDTVKTAENAEAVLAILGGRWKMLIVFHLFGQALMRFSELERAIPAVSQKMLTQQLRELERDGVVARTIHAEVPPRVDYRLTAWGRALCPAIDALLWWGASKPALGVEGPEDEQGAVPS